MRAPIRALRLLALLALLFEPVVSAPSLAAQRVVPVHREPRHRVVLDRMPLRVMDIQILPGDTTLFHTHASAILYVGLSASATDSRPLDGTWGGPPAEAPSWNPGVVFQNLDYADEPYTHRVANVGDGPFRLMAVTNHGPGAPEVPEEERPARPGSPERHNPWFRQWRLRLAPGEGTEPLPAPTPVVAVQVTAGEAVVMAGERVEEVLGGPGAWVHRPPGAAYRIRNRGDADVELVVVEVR